MQSGREDNLEERYAIKFCFKLGKNATETYGMLQTAFQPSCMNQASVFEWHKRFKEGRESVRDDERCGRSKEVNTPELIGQRVRVTILQLPISSLVEEFKIGKVRLHMMMKDSADEIIRKAYPEIKSGTKWSAVKTAQEAECSLRIKDIIGVTQTNRAGLGSTSKKVFFKMDPKGKRDIVSEEVRMFEEEQRKASAVTQAK